MARPSTYTAEVAEQICTRLADGESLRCICADEGMPGKTTLMRWLEDHAEFRDQYARAREQQADRYVEDTVEIADAASPESVHVARLQVDARKWAAAKLAPKKYGEHAKVEVTGAGGGPVGIVQYSAEQLARLPEAELQALLAAVTKLGQSAPE